MVSSIALDIQIPILSHLDANSLHAMESTCTRYRDLISTESLWSQIGERYGLSNEYTKNPELQRDVKKQLIQVQKFAKEKLNLSEPEDIRNRVNSELFLDQESIPIRHYQARVVDEKNILEIFKKSDFFTYLEEQVDLSTSRIRKEKFINALKKNFPEDYRVSIEAAKLLMRSGYILDSSVITFLISNLTQENERAVFVKDSLRLGAKFYVSLEGSSTETRALQILLDYHSQQLSWDAIKSLVEVTKQDPDVLCEGLKIIFQSGRSPKFSALDSLTLCLHDRPDILLSCVQLFVEYGYTLTEENVNLIIKKTPFFEPLIMYFFNEQVSPSVRSLEAALGDPNQGYQKFFYLLNSGIQVDETIYPILMKELAYSPNLSRRKEIVSLVEQLISREVLPSSIESVMKFCITRYPEENVIRELLLKAMQANEASSSH